MVIVLKLDSGLIIPQLFALDVHRNATVEEVWDQNFGQGGWNLRFFRAFNDWELDLIGNLLTVLRGYRLKIGRASCRERV